MTESAIKEQSKSFSGNSKRAWISSFIILALALIMFLLDLSANNWTFALGFNVIDLAIIILLIWRWRTSIVIDHENIRVKQIQARTVPLAKITRLSIVHSPLLGYVAAIDWTTEGSKRSKRASFFASFYKEGQTEVFLKTLHDAVPESAQIELAPKYKQELQSHGAS